MSPNNLEALSNSSKSLIDKENASYIKKDKIIPISKDCVVDAQSLHDQLIEEEFETDTTKILKIKKPDYLGNSMWEFKHDNHYIKAKISDEKWLKKYQSGEEPTAPGDALKVKIKESFKYDKHGNVISSIHKIYEVIKILRQIEDKQINAF